MMTMNIAMMRMTTTDPIQEAMRTATAIHTRRGIIIMGIQPLVTMSNSTMTMITTCGDQRKHHYSFLLLLVLDFLRKKWRKKREGKKRKNLPKDFFLTNCSPWWTRAFPLFHFLSHSVTHILWEDEYIAWLLFHMRGGLDINYCISIFQPLCIWFCYPVSIFLYYNNQPPLWMCHDTRACDLPSMFVVCTVILVFCIASGVFFFFFFHVHLAEVHIP